MLVIRSEKVGRKRWLFLIIPIVLLLVAYPTFQLLRPLPAPTYTLKSISTPSVGVTYDWQPNAIAAIRSDDGLNLSSPDAGKVVPIASIAKLITILTVLKSRPIAIGENGPSISINASDIERTASYKAQGGTYAVVSVGQQWTERQMIDAMVVGSSNNIADALAIWAFGSLEAYRNAAQEFVTANGLTATTVGSDASGLSPSTTSSATDLLSLSMLAHGAEPIKTAASLDSVTVPGNYFPSTNHLLGVDGVTGLKTGTSDQAGNCFVYTASLKSGDTTHTFYGVILDATTTDARFRDADALLKAAYSHYSERVVASSGSVAGSRNAAWGSSTPVVLSSDLTRFTWDGNAASTKITINQSVSDDRKGTVVGKITCDGSSANLVLADDVSPPNILWELTRLQ